jgi:hypothetical protein
VSYLRFRSHIDSASRLYTRNPDYFENLHLVGIFLGVPDMNKETTATYRMVRSRRARRTERPGKGRWATNDQRRRDRSDLGEAPRRAGHRGSVRVGFQPIRANLNPNSEVERLLNFGVQVKRLRQEQREWHGRLARYFCSTIDGRDARPTLTSQAPKFRPKR